MKRRLTEQEFWTLWTVVLLLFLGIAGKIWLAKHPPKTLPALPHAPSSEESAR